MVTVGLQEVTVGGPQNKTLIVDGFSDSGDTAFSQTPGASGRGTGHLVNKLAPFPCGAQVLGYLTHFP